MPELVDMKFTPEERKEEQEDMKACHEVPEYPYGLNIYLDDESVSKLGTEFKAGEEVMVVARAKVKRVSTREEDTEEDGSEVNSSVELQITNMAVEGAPASNSEKANRLFPTMNQDEE